MKSETCRFRVLRWIVCWLLVMGAGRVAGSEPRLVSSGPEGVEVEVDGEGYALRRVTLEGRAFDRVDLPGGVWLTDPGHPAVPVWAVLLGVPYGAGVSVEVVEADYEEVGGVNLMPVPEALFVGRGDVQMPQLRYRTNGEVYAQDRFYPAQQAVVTRTGVMRDQRVVAVSLRPVQYNPVRKALRVARRLRVRVRFAALGAARPAVRPAGEGEGGPFEPVYRGALLNAEQARAWRGRPGRLGKAQANGYDPAVVYYKVRVREDGLYRLDADWFADSGIEPDPGDLARLKLFLNGAEVPLEVRDGGDGRLDAGDGVFFYGRFRRAPDRDFESEFGREQVYWLTLEGAEGRRFQRADGAVRSGFPEVTVFLNRVHVEVDSMYEALGNAEDALRDHWFWRRTASPSSVGGQVFPVTVEVVLPGLDREAGGTGRVRVGMHGLTLRREIDPDHRTVVRLGEGTEVAEDRWDGQTAFLAEGEALVSELRDTTRVTLTTPGSPEFPLEPVPYVDHVLFNWVEITYPRRFEAVEGSLLFELETGEGGRTVSISGFRTPEVSVYDLGGERVLEGVETVADGAGFRAQFEVPPGGGRFLAVEAEAARRADPALRDNPSDLRGERVGSDCVIVTHARFREAAERLADHRRAGGLSVQVVDVADLYDEFAFGQFEPEAVRRFVAHAFETWARRPSYLLLFGKASFDYRDLFGEARFERRDFVPALPFQAIRRGLAFTDHLFGTVAGEDLFPDLFVGRLSVSRRREADTVVRKVTGYDLAPPEPWRDRILYMANFDADSIFTQPSNALSADYAEPLGLASFKVYNRADTGPEPNEDSREVIRQINEGRLVVNFMGHGSVASMAFFLRGTFQQQNFNYVTQIVNGDRLPLMIAMSCLNGLYADPRLICLAEEMVNKEDGGAVAYVSASALALVFSNNFINTAMFRYFFQDGIRQFGQSLALAKVDLLTAFPGLQTPAMGMNLIGDPAQALAVLPGPDFSLPADGLKIDRTGELVVGDSTRIQIRIENLGIVPEEGLQVVLVDRNLDRAGIDTLFAGRLPPFGQADSLVVLWRLAGLAGRHRLEAVLDPENRIEELDEENNRRELDLEVFGALTAVPTVPQESQVVPAAGVRLAVRPGAPAEEEGVGEFEVSRTPGFEGPEVIRSGAVGGEAGLVVWRPSGLEEGIYFWRARLTEGEERGAWTRPRGFVTAASVPERELVWQQQGAEAFRQGTLQDVALFEGQSVGRVQEPPPVRFNGETREAAVTAQGVSGTAVLCTDGTYLYVKRFYTSPPIYPGTDRFERIGTGFGGTVAGQNYGVLSELPIRGISATCHSDGFLYAEDGKAHELVRISLATGAVDRVRVPDGLLEVQTGLVFDGHSLITSDGTHIYNVSSGVNGVRRAGWAVRVFDPADGWRLLRAFEVEPTSTGFGYLFTDGILADGRFLYLIEFGTGLTHRVRVVDARDGRFVEEFESDQAETDILGGQYDWVNNRVWLGQLKGPMVTLYPGRRLPDFGSVTSSPIGPAGAWGRLQTTVRPGATAGSRAEVDILGEDASGTFLPLPEWSGLAAGSEIDLSGLEGGVRRIRLEVRLFGEGLNRSPGLAAWSVRYQPLSDLGLFHLRAEPKAVQEVQTVKLTVDVLNRGPLDLALGSVLAFYSGTPEAGRLIGRMAVPETTPLGEVRATSLVWNTAQFPGQHLVTVRLEDLQGSPSFYDRQAVADDPVEVTSSGDRGVPVVEMTALDAAGEVRPEDYLPAEPTFRIVARDSSGIDPASVQLLLTGGAGEVSEDLSSNRVRDREENRTSLTFVYGTARLEDGRYVLAVSASDRLGNGPAQKALAFQVSSNLQIEKVLAAPNPMATETAFTYVLSRPAEVTVRIYTVSGRLIRRLEDAPGRAGFNQAHWDGLDGDGHPLANGVYLYTVTAEDGSEQVRVKERLIVYR